MIDYLIKSSLCLVLLLTIYFSLLEKEKMHKFNRFYLLFGLIFSILVPFIHIEIYKEAASVIEVSEINNTRDTIPNTVIGPLETVSEPQQGYIIPGLLIVYSIITAFFLYRFIKNIRSILIAAHRNKKVSYRGATLVLTEDTSISHTFLSYIFINEKEYESGVIQEQILSHELTHVDQKHTLDILLVELIHLVFWFNPILVLYKKAIQLNHEFLADEGVLSIYKDVSVYQTLLLSKIGPVNIAPLTNSFNYLITKKRLIMMTKHVNKTRALLKKIALLPLFSVLIFFFSAKVVAQRDVAHEADIKESLVTITERSMESATRDDTIVKAIKDDKSEASEKEGDSLFINNKTEEVGKAEEVAASVQQQFTSVEVSPLFPGGMKEFHKFINVHTPLQGTSGKVEVIFYVDKDGTVEVPEISKESISVNEKAVYTAIAKSPKWKPAIQNGNPVKIGYTMAVTFIVPSTIITVDKVEMINEEMFISFEKDKKDDKVNIQGTVLDKDGKPIVGATIRSNDSKAGVISDKEGYFSIVLLDSQTLTISCVGYVNKHINL